MAQLPDHLDLHLIRILYLLLCEKNVSRVALKLDQPQPSISASLRKLRELTGDPLLVRGGRGMVPTQHGESLKKPAKRILDEVSQLFLHKTPFASMDESRVFRIGAPDYLDIQFLPNIVARMRRESPKSRIVIHSLGAEVDSIRMLSDGDLDLLIANWDAPPEHLHLSPLFEDPIVCAMRADSPYAKRTGADDMTLDDYLSLPHVAPSPTLSGYHGVIDTYLQQNGHERNVVVESAYFGLMPHMLTQTDLVLTTGRQYLRFFERNLPIKTFTVPLRFPPMRFYQLWHERVHAAPEHKWLRDQITQAAQALTAK
ncbi:LysR family transcriptional regulator [Rugamonas sp. CCM 8940]|uniref:LysR family transcriptional regulator n=1 Tax=Rugamonas sp. CCM 8940 TaxID=2765359 RepID=UPI0018F78A17|nr:LysR family transcriptional regulator [Rugamonas sp. CCM 8940]MBJ7313200.1 LysR family transcriptional regulator [Rugamonas sp. CCM 8940]